MSPAKKTPESTSSRPVLLLLDGHSLAYRAYYALKEADLRTTTGQPTGARGEDRQEGPPPGP